MAEPFATSGDLEDRWQDLDARQTRRADALLAAASRRIRAKFSTIDARAALPAEDPDRVDPELLADIVCEMVREVMGGPPPGGTQQSASVGSVSTSTSFAADSGRLYISKATIELLTPAITRTRASSTSSLPDHARL